MNPNSIYEADLSDGTEEGNEATTNLENSYVSRRAFLQWGGVTGASVFLAACGVSTQQPESTGQEEAQTDSAQEKIIVEEQQLTIEIGPNSQSNLEYTNALVRELYEQREDKDEIKTEFPVTRENCWFCLADFTQIINLPEDTVIYYSNTNLLDGTGIIAYYSPWYRINAPMVIEPGISLFADDPNNPDYIIESIEEPYKDLENFFVYRPSGYTPDTNTTPRDLIDRKIYREMYDKEENYREYDGKKYLYVENFTTDMNSLYGNSGRVKEENFTINFVIFNGTADELKGIRRRSMDRSIEKKTNPYGSLEIYDSLIDVIGYTKSGKPVVGLIDYGANLEILSQPADTALIYSFGSFSISTSNDNPQSALKKWNEMVETAYKRAYE